MTKHFKIGTRDSELAMWQATTVQSQLEALGHTAELVTIKSEGDLNLTESLYEMGITGIFTKTLDVALVKGTIDLAVHSLKDVPTSLPNGMVQAAVLERASSNDILVYKKDFNPDQEMVIATGSLRRKAQWLHTNPHHTITDLRGNVNTRLAKLYAQPWNAAIFAKAGLQRIGLLDKLRANFGFEYVDLDSTIPAPAQGAMMIAAMETNVLAVAAAKALNHEKTAICTDVERLFLRILEGGCSAPIGAIATIDNNMLYFKGCLLSLDGKTRLNVLDTVSLTELQLHGIAPFVNRAANHILNDGGRELMVEIKSAMK